jgi:hypothetical protein
MRFEHVVTAHGRVVHSFGFTGVLSRGRLENRRRIRDAGWFEWSAPAAEAMDVPEARGTEIVGAGESVWGSGPGGRVGWILVVERTSGGLRRGRLFDQIAPGWRMRGFSGETEWPRAAIG